MDGDFGSWEFFFQRLIADEMIEVTMSDDNSLQVEFFCSMNLMTDAGGPPGSITQQTF